MAGDVEAKFTVRVDDGVSGTADQAAAALKRLKGSIDADKAALSQMQGAMRALQSAGTVNIATFRELQGRIEAQKQKIGDATSKYVQLGGVFGKTKKGADDAKAGFAGMLDAIKGAPGPLGSMAARLSSMTGMLPAVAAAAGIFAIVAGLAALVVATGAATAALFKYGLAQAEARRNELGRLEGLTLMRTRHRAAAGSAEDLQRAIDRVSGSSSTGRQELEGMTERLYRMGFRGVALERALEGATTATEVLGERGGNRFLAMAAHARRTGGDVGALADRIQARLGPAAARRALSWDSQIARLGRNFGQIFGGLRIDGLLTSLKRVTDLFSLNNESGKALKELFETIFQPFVDDAEGAMPIVEDLILMTILGALRMVNSLKEVRNAWLRTFGPDVFSGVNGVLGPTQMLSNTLRTVARNASVTLAALQGMSRIGGELVQGLLNGTRGGTGPFASTMRALAAAGIAAFRDEMGIRSPSRVFAGLGYQLPAGVAQGVERGTPEVEHAIEHMVSVPASPDMQAVTDASPAGTARAGAAGGITLTVGDIYVTGGSDARDIAQAIRDEVVTMLEGVAISMGAPT